MFLLDSKQIKWNANEDFYLHFLYLRFFLEIKNSSKCVSLKEHSTFFENRLIFQLPKR